MAWDWKNNTLIVQYRKPREAVTAGVYTGSHFSSTWLLCPPYNSK
jgi:hypothetical protein